MTIVVRVSLSCCKVVVGSLRRPSDSFIECKKKSWKEMANLASRRDSSAHALINVLVARRCHTRFSMIARVESLEKRTSK